MRATQTMRAQHTPSRRRRRWLSHIRSATACCLLMIGVACGDPLRDEEMEACLATLQASPAMLLVGEEGGEAICSCTVEKLRTRFPDAAQRWVDYETDFTEKLESRGILGIVVDSSWVSERGGSFLEFAGAHAQALGVCSESLFADWTAESRK
jgi:hypothetical protein